MSEQGRVVVTCPAKLNLFLEVVGRREDGYHEIDTVMQAVDLCDELVIEPRADGLVVLECDDPELPTDEGNLVVRAALALREATGCRAGASVRLTKRVPAQAGLGGGSSDAAGALVGLNTLWGLGLGVEELVPVAAAVGSDVAFFLWGGTARCRGRGEVVEALGVGGVFRYVLVCPGVGVPTGEAYGKLRFPLTPVGADISMTVQSVANSDAGGVARALFNRLEGPACALRPELLAVRERLMECGLFSGVCMTGSGSALFGVCEPKVWARAGRCVGTMGLGAVWCVSSVGHGATARWVP